MIDKSQNIDIDSLPQSINDWLVSVPLTYLIIDLNKRLGVYNNAFKMGAIPDFVVDIVTKRMPPQELAKKLEERLQVPSNQALSVAREIKEKILRPIEVALRKELGVDINAIDFIQPGQTMPATPPPTTPAFQVPPRPIAPPTQVFQSPSKPTPPTSPTASPSTTPTPNPQPLETKIPINVIKDENKSDSWLNRLK